MAVLKRKSDQKEILGRVGTADRFHTRLVGLLSTKNLPQGQGLWIHDCNSIHTFFMKYPIDCIFLDANMKIVSLVPQVKPWRMVWPQFKAKSVIEMAADQLQKLDLQIGEELYVGD